MANGKIEQIEVNGEVYEISSIPDEGKTGTVLTKTEEGFAWKDNTLLKAWKGTMSEYNKIDVKDDETIYFIVNEIVGDEEE